MSERRVIFQCAHCSERTHQGITASEVRQATQRAKQKFVYCEHCGRPNIIEISPTWGVRPLVLGDDSVLDIDNGIPVIQGRLA